MIGLGLGLLGLYYTLLVLLAVYALHRVHLVRLRRRTARRLDAEPSATTSWPHLAVQLPVFNEPNVVERLIDAACALSYPGRLTIQVLDDSTDSTTAIAAQRVFVHRENGIDIALLRRDKRDGFKAGALAHGMRLTDADLFAVFDADFIPPPDLLVRMVPFLLEGGVGMVQARWDHLNRDDSMLTRAQAVFLDGHFAVESSARSSAGLFFNFNGTAGIWRRQAIEDAGGWSASTLTEDLDLSYRAQLAGWRFVFLPEVTVPSEIPPTLSGFRQQQHRWAKGSIQTARKLLPAILRAGLPVATRVEAFFHLTGNLAYLMTLLLALLVVPSILVRNELEMAWSIPIDLAVFLITSGAVLYFYFEGQKLCGQPRPRLLTALSLLPFGISLAVRNASAVIEGLAEEGGRFHRTPKSGGGSVTGSLFEQIPDAPWAETALFLFYLASVFGFGVTDDWRPVPILMLFVGGFGYAAVVGLAERWRFGVIPRFVAAHRHSEGRALESNELV